MSSPVLVSVLLAAALAIWWALRQARPRPPVPDTLGLRQRLGAEPE
jgi:hypothetical protein